MHIPLTLADIQAEANQFAAQMHSKVLPVDDIEAASIATQLMAMGGIPVGYLTISNALQWRLQYTRVIAHAGKVEGIVKIF